MPDLYILCKPISDDDTRKEEFVKQDDSIETKNLTCPEGKYFKLYNIQFGNYDGNFCINENGLCDSTYYSKLS